MDHNSSLVLFFSGAHVTKLRHYSMALGDFNITHPLSVDEGQEEFEAQVLHWHTDLLIVQVTFVSETQICMMLVFSTDCNTQRF